MMKAVSDSQIYVQQEQCMHFFLQPHLSNGQGWFLTDYLILCKTENAFYIDLTPRPKKCSLIQMLFWIKSNKAGSQE